MDGLSPLLALLCVWGWERGLYVQVLSGGEVLGVVEKVNGLGLL